MNNNEQDSSTNLYRIHKIIAKRGYCSTRAAEKLIKEKKIKVNGEIVKLGDQFPLNCSITIGNLEIKDEFIKDITYILNKPIGYECSKKTFKNINKSIFSLLPHHQKLQTIGRLDVKTSGLIILTTNGKLNQEIIHPKSNIIKTYRVKLHLKMNNDDIELLLDEGIKIEHTYSKAQYIKFISEKKGGFEYEIGVSEGKKHLIRLLFGELGYVVKALERTKIGNLDLYKLNLKSGEYKKIKEELLLKLIRK